MFANKTPGATVPARPYKKQLEYLQARKSAIDTLIQSLEEYDRYRAILGDGTTRKSA